MSVMKVGDASLPNYVVPANAGTQRRARRTHSNSVTTSHWVPAFAGTTSVLSAAATVRGRT
jgi:hypothetical protein